LRLGHDFARRELLEQALTHTSRANELGDLLRGNERLEFLGDAVLDLIVSEILMAQHPDRSEGWLSRARAGAVNQRALAARARELELPFWIRLGRSERRTGGDAKPSILSNMFEAVIGAIYLDGGLDAVRPFLERVLGPALADPDALADPKTRLQELLQARGAPTPAYRTAAEHGPPHAREFHVEVHLGDQRLGVGKGRSKRDAEQEAARDALEREPR
jgi:ribonuclease-3